VQGTAVRTDIEVMGDLVVVDVSGELNIGTCSVLDETITKALTETSAEALAIDLTDCDFLDSA